MSEKERYLQKYQAQTDEWEAEVARLAAGVSPWLDALVGTRRLIAESDAQREGAGDEREGTVPAEVSGPA